jgi:hypothetical protein
MATFSNNFGAKTSKTSNIIFECSLCDYKCSKKSNLDRHILTPKHMKAMVGNNLATENEQKEQTYMCKNCNKEYLSKNGLWRHKQKCTVQEDSEYEIKKPNEPSDKEIIMMLIKDNSELKNMMMEQQNIMMKVIENGTHNTNNSHNKTFNLQFFLNETCKDAMNIMDFVDSIQLQLSDLENVGKLGYVNGISNIIVKNLKELDIEKRPVHCTDKKRETMYVKDENKWEKDDGNKKICNAIKKVVSKNQRLIPKFKEAHPDCNTYHSKFSDQYNKLILESCGGSGDNDLEKEEKIIQNISKNVLVDK